MGKIKQTSLFNSILRLAWPTMLEQLMQTLVQYIDLIMVGSLGTVATAAVGSTTTINWLIGSSISALGVGFLSYIARALGANNINDAKRASAQSVLVTLVAGVFFTVLTLSLSSFVPGWMQVDANIQKLSATYFFIIYSPMLFRCATTLFSTVLRGAGDTKTPMKIGVVVNIVNVVLNFLFIYPNRQFSFLNINISLYGLNLGVVGAALASSIAFVIGGILTTIALFKHPLVSPKRQKLLPDKDILIPCLKVALPNMLQRFGTSLGYVVFAGMINSLGEISTAAHTVANTVESAFYIPGYGMQAAAATLAGNAVGKKDKNMLNKLCKYLIIIEGALMIVSGAILFVFAPHAIRLFSQDENVLHLSTIVLRMVALSEPFYGISIILEGMLQGMGKTMHAFIYNIVGMWGIRIVGTFICTQILSFGLESAWACMIAHNLLLFFLFSFHWLRKRNKFI